MIVVSPYGYHSNSLDPLTHTHTHTHTHPSPSGLSYEDTYNTLKYADRAKQIKTKVLSLCVYVHV